MKLAIVLSFAITLILSNFAMAFEIEDFLFHIETRLNQSKTLSEFVSKTPGSLAQRTEFVKTLRNLKIDQHQPPIANRTGTRLELDLKPKLVLDFAKISVRIVKVNGKEIDLKTSSDYLADFRKAYTPKFSWFELAFPQVQAQTSVAGNENTIRDQISSTLNSALNRAASAAEIAYLHSIASVDRCDQGMDDCPFMSHAETIMERLTKGHHTGLQEFKCENGRLKSIQAAHGSFEKQLPRYEFVYKKNSDEVRIKVQNYGLTDKRKTDCEFIYNDKTKAIRATSAGESCRPATPADLTSIGFSTPVGPAFRCCQKTNCEAQVLKFKETVAQRSQSQPVEQKVPLTK